LPCIFGANKKNMRPTSPIQDNFLYPAGPLKYLLLYKNGTALLGIFRSRKTHQFYLVVHCLRQYFVFAIDFAMLNGLVENRLIFKDVLLQCPFTTLKGKIPSLFTKYLLYLWMLYYLNGTISSLKRAVVYPNYFYEFNAYLHHPDTHQQPIPQL
jgi:hypothetical protein